MTRLLARQLRRVFLKVVGGTRRGASPLLSIEAGPAGILFRALGTDAAIAYHLEGNYPPQQWTIPLEVLQSCEGGRRDTVRFERLSPEQLQLRWEEGGVPQAFTVEVLEGEPEFPPLPETWRRNPARLGTCLRDAQACSDDTSSRYALHCLQLRGSAGQIVATDGRQMLLQSGFDFPWQDDLLIPASCVFACRELDSEGEIEVGQVGDWTVFRRGPWTLHLAIAKEARFPEVERVIPSRHSGTRLRLSEADALFLEKSLPRLPGRVQLNSPITLDLNGQVAVRAQGGDHRPNTELVLTSAEWEGEPLRVCTNRGFLLQAVRMGFRELWLAAAHAPILCEAEQRQYVWATLDAQAAIGPSADSIRVAGPMAAVARKLRRRSRPAASV